MSKTVGTHAQKYTMSKGHPALDMPFDELYENLEEQVGKGLLIRQEDGHGLVLYNYVQYEVAFENLWDKYNVLARGLILDPGNKQVVACPFPKFWNYDELSGRKKINLEDYFRMPKMDGSLGIIYWHPVLEMWKVATRGSFNSDQAQWAERHVRHCGLVGPLRATYTYLAEIIYPENRIVCGYDFEGLSLLGVYDLVNNQFIAPNTIFHNGLEGLEKVFVDYSAPFALREGEWTVDDVKGDIKDDEEGFVLWNPDNNFRFKIKGDEYCRLHRIVTGLSKKRIWESMLNGGDSEVEALKGVIPDEFYEQVEEWQKEIKTSLTSLLDKVRILHERTNDMDDRDCGMFLKNNPVDSTARGFVFPCRKLDFMDKVHVAGSDMRKKAFKTFEPKG